MAANAPTTSEDHEALTEQQRAVTDCTQVDAPSMTATPPRPTRRELRAAQASLDLAATGQPEVTVHRASVPDGSVTVLVSRRSLRASAAGGAEARTAGASERPQAQQHPAAGRRALRDVSPPRSAAPRPSSGLAVRLGKTTAALALTGALVVSGIAFQRGDSAEARTAATEAAVRAQVARSSAAQTDRLTAQATAYAQGRQAQALAAAQAALAQTDTVVLTASPVLDAETLTPLQDAAAELKALVEAGGGTAPLSTAGVEATAAQAQGTIATPSPQDALRDEAASRASRSAAEGRAPLVAPPATEAPAPAGDATADPDAEESPAPVDLETSEQLLAMAAQVTTLSAEVQTTVDAKVAEAQAQALAQAAEEAAAAEMARKVELAKNADNGEIPTDVLCAPSFEPQALLRCDAAQALEHLNAAYKTDFGRDLDIVSSYRSYSAQVATRRSRGWLAAVPGTSNHGLALAVDLGSFGSLGNFSTPSYRWMKSHAGDFGWSHPSLMERGGGGPQEPWHWEFGTP